MTKIFRSRPFAFFVLVATSGCTQSFPTSYSEGRGITVVQPARTQTLAIAKFDDKRSFAQRNDKKATSFIGVQSPWMFGMTHRGRQYTPVSDLVQDLFVTELNTAGLKAVASETASSDVAALQNAARQAKTDYALGGQILVFEFVNDAGMWTVTSRRTVTMAITLVPAEGEAVMTNTMVTHSDAENEGMAVMHTTNVDKLMNGCFKDVVNQVISAVATKMAVLPADIDVRLSYGGRIFRFPAVSTSRSLAS